MQRVGFSEIENDDLPTDGEQRNHYDRADLDNGVTALGHHQKGFLEFERNDHREDHTEHGLEDRVVGWVEAPGQNEPEQNFQAQVPDGSDDDNGDQCRQEHDDDAFESLIE